MKYSSASFGRVFVLRLEHGDLVREQIERFAQVQNIRAAALVAIGGIDKGSPLVVGPEKGRSVRVTPMRCVLDEVHEVSGTGTIFRNANGNPVLHMHVAAGRKKSAKAGCVRKGVKVWHVLEVVVFELAQSTAKRVPDQQSGLELLEP
jgi:predicted DNA-binding protein with PD1-like motif